MTINSLGLMTHILNKREYVPINYILNFIDNNIAYSMHYTDIEREIIKSLILAQLPHIFKRYGIVVSKLDIINLIDADYNIASESDVEDFLTNCEGYNDNQLMERSFFLDFYNYFILNFNPYIQKYKSLKQDKRTLDDYIKEEITELYGYDFDKKNSDCFDIFQVFLANHIEDYLKDISDKKRLIK